MSYTITKEDYNLTIDFLALLNCDIRQMERDNKTLDISYACKCDRLKGEVNMLSFLFDIETDEIYKMISIRADNIERAYIPINKSFSII